MNELSLLAVTSVVAIWWYFLKGRKSLLRDLGGPPSPSVLTGNLGQLFAKDGWNFARDITGRYGNMVLLHGLFNKPFLYTTDPKALHHLLVKDQHIFEETDEFVELNDVIFGQGLLSTLGDHHRKQRKSINVAFSTKHLREMVPTMYELAHKMAQSVERASEKGTKEVNMMEWISRTALEIIGQTGLGYSFDQLGEELPHPYSNAVKDLSPTIFDMPWIRPLILPLKSLGPPWFRRTLLERVPLKNVQVLRNIIDLMDSTSRSIFAEKKASVTLGNDYLQKQAGRGLDIMTILLKQNMTTLESDRLAESELIGQMSTLIFTATDTTSSAATRVLHLLSEHPDVQEKLRQEILDCSSEDIDHDELLALPYLDAVCRETLRLFPSIPFIGRIARQDGQLPLLSPIRTAGGTMTSIVQVPKGTNIFVGLAGTNTCPEIWGKNALHWKPERWLNPLPPSVADANIPGVYANLMTFSAGGRSCIGFRYANIELRVLLATLLRKFRFSPSSQSVEWRLGVVTSPVTEGPDGEQVALPLQVSPL